MDYNFYKYKGKEIGLLHHNEVFNVSLEDDTLYLENNYGAIFICPPSITLDKDFIKSGIQFPNWKNKNYTISENDKVNHPSHYKWLKDLCGIEVIDITRWLNFNIGNVIKYTLRAGHKNERGYNSKQKQIEDLKKAVWYLNDEIKRLGSENI